MNKEKTLNNHIVTPELIEMFKNYPLYSQDDKKTDAMCVALFRIGNIRWYMLEGNVEHDDFIFFGIVLGLYETEYGYHSANEMANISYNASMYGQGTLRIERDESFKPCKLSEIDDTELQNFLGKLYS